MLRFFKVPGFEGSIALEVHDPGKPMFELKPDGTIQQVENPKVFDAIQQCGGNAERDWSIFTINVSNMTFAISASPDTFPMDVSVLALEYQQKFAACDIDGPVDVDWHWLKIGAKAALIAWMAWRQKKQMEDSALPNNMN